MTGHDVIAVQELPDAEGGRLFLLTLRAGGTVPRMMDRLTHDQQTYLIVGLVDPGEQGPVVLALLQAARTD